MKKLGHKNLPVLTNKYGPIYKKCQFELVNVPDKGFYIKVFTRRFSNKNNIEL